MDNTKPLEFGVSELYYSIYDENNKTYSKPQKMAAAANFSLTAYEDTLKFKGLDGIEIDVETTGAGYDGTISVYALSTQFLQDAWGYEIAENGLITEKQSTGNKQIAILYTSNPYRYVFYNCRIKRPNIELETVTKQTNINKINLKISIRPTEDAEKKIRSLCSKSCSLYNDWFNEVV